MKFIPDSNVRKVINLLKEKRFEELVNSELKDNMVSGKVRYSLILSEIKRLKDDERDRLHRNCQEFIDYTEEITKKNKGKKNKNNDDINATNYTIDVVNYLLLEIPRANDYSKLTRQAQQSEKLIRVLRTQERDTKDLMDKVDKIKSEFIAMLSIFSAIIIAFFGGIQILGGVLDNIDNTNFYILTIITLVIGLVIFNVIYMLLYTVGKLVDKNIGIKVDEKLCKSCDRSNRLQCFKTKYPVPFVYNIGSLVLIVITYILYNVDKMNLVTYWIENITWMLEHNKYIGLVACYIIIPIVIVFIISIIIGPNLKKSKIELCTKSN